MTSAHKVKRKRITKPHFVKVKLLKDGSVMLTDDDGEKFHIEMRKEFAWPMLSRQVRRYEMMEKIEKRPESDKPTPPGPPGIRLIK